MRFPDKIRLDLAASKDETRFILNHVLVQGDMAVATDGKVLCACQVEPGEDDARDTALLLPETVKSAQTMKDELFRGIVQLRESSIMVDRLVERRVWRDVSAPSMNYPAWRSLARGAPNPFGANTVNVKLSVDSLMKLVKAIGGDYITLSFDIDENYFSNGMVLVTDPCRNDVFGMMSPCTLNVHGLNNNKALNHAISTPDTTAEPVPDSADDDMEGGKEEGGAAEDEY